MLAAARAIGAAGRVAAVITNDQGEDLVDTTSATAALPEAAVSEITGGCFCCRYDELAETLERIAAAGTDLVLAEAVGSCTDLAATVVAPLQQYRPELVDLAPLTTVVDAARLAELGERDDELGYLFDRQLAEAELVLLNKIDLLGPAESAAVAASLTGRYPQARLLPLSATNGQGLPAVLQAWQGAGSAAAPVPVDYDRYAAAEAALGWLNQTWNLDADRLFDPAQWCRDVLVSLGRLFGPDVVLGHAKIAVRGATGLTKAALVSATGEPRVDLAASGPITNGTAVLNVRATRPPSVVEEVVARSVLAASQGGMRAVAGPATAFAPGYPRPIHRMGAPR